MYWNQISFEINKLEADLASEVLMDLEVSQLLILMLMMMLFMSLQSVRRLFGNLLELQRFSSLKLVLRKLLIH